MACVWCSACSMLCGTGTKRQATPPPAFGMGRGRGWGRGVCDRQSNYINQRTNHSALLWSSKLGPPRSFVSLVPCFSPSCQIGSRSDSLKARHLNLSSTTDCPWYSRLAPSLQDAPDFDLERSRPPPVDHNGKGACATAEAPRRGADSSREAGAAKPALGPPHAFEDLQICPHDPEGTAK